MKTLKVPFQIDSTGKVATVSGRQAEIRQQILSLVHTRVRERVMRPAFGTRAFDFLFDPLDELLVTGMKSDLRDSIGKHIPEVELMSLDAKVEDSMLELGFTYRLRDIAGSSTVDVIEIDVGGTVRRTSEVHASPEGP